LLLLISSTFLVIEFFTYSLFIPCSSIPLFFFFHCQGPMSFSIPPLFRKRDKKSSEPKCYPTLASISQPRISSSTLSYRSCNSTSTIAYEELEENDFYLYFRSSFETLFKRSSVVCIPYSRRLHGVTFNRHLIGKPTQIV
jgi:hypothetical protein